MSYSKWKFYSMIVEMQGRAPERKMWSYLWQFKSSDGKMTDVADAG